jgi:CheY-like chemotaxis protein
MYSDSTKIRQILLNLLSNAGKFTEQGHITLRATREGGAAGDWICISVTDTGIGISAQQIEQLFTEFTQADPSASRKYGGTGLGLALSRRLCRLLGGDIALTSATGHGSTFTVRLPASIAEQRAAAVAPRRNTMWTGAPLEPPATPELASVGTVLVIDDDPATRDLLGRSLAAADLSAITAANAEDGVLLAQALQPDVIILDVLLPDRDGWEVLAALKADPELKDIPVIMFTIVDDRGRGLRLGATEYLIKPVDSEQLITLICSYMERDSDRAHTSLPSMEDDPIRSIETQLRY